MFFKQVYRIVLILLRTAKWENIKKLQNIIKYSKVWYFKKTIVQSEIKFKKNLICIFKKLSRYFIVIFNKFDWNTKHIINNSF